MLKVKTPDGFVHIRVTDNDYPCALAGTTDGVHWWVSSWHSREDLARKEAGKALYSKCRTKIVYVGDHHGPCGRCDGSKEITCTKCHGKITKQIAVYGMREVPGSTYKESYIKEYREWTCNCKTGKRKCPACKGKGKL